jgi:hypothetical protein
MKLQLLSDLHLETEDFDPTRHPAPSCWCWPATSTAAWAALARFAGWPVPVLMVPATMNSTAATCATAGPACGALCRQSGHPPDRARERGDHQCRRASGALRRHGALERFRPLRRGRARTGDARRRPTSCADGLHPDGAPFDAEGCARRVTGLPRLAGYRTAAGPTRAPQGRWDTPWWSRTSRPACAVPTRATASQPGTASFCNADDDLIPRADLWLHGHLHCRHDYTVPRPGRAPRGWSARPCGLVPRARPRASTRCADRPADPRLDQGQGPPRGGATLRGIRSPASGARP